MDTKDSRHDRVELVSHSHPNPRCGDCTHCSKDTDLQTDIHCELKKKQVKCYNKCNFFAPTDPKGKI